jgi:hypothetical protein
MSQATSPSNLDTAAAVQAIKQLGELAAMKPTIDRELIKSQEEAKLAKEPKVFVTIPEFDLIGAHHSGVTINHVYFGPGRHSVSETLAAEIEDRLAKKNAQDMRIMQPLPDKRAVAIQSQGTPGLRGGQVVTA